jgi:ATP phosphoribosyltransferase
LTVTQIGTGRLHEKCVELLNGSWPHIAVDSNKTDAIRRSRHPVSTVSSSRCLCLPQSPDSVVRARDFAISSANTHIRVFLPASDIPSFVGKGSVDVGITGMDVIREAKMEGLVNEELRLAFGKCALQVQVPVKSPFKTVEDLAGKRVVTSFEVLAGEYFAQIDDQLNLKEGERTKVEYVGGSVEAACALGLADGIGECVTPPELSGTHE